MGPGQEIFFLTNCTSYQYPPKDDNYAETLSKVSNPVIAPSWWDSGTEEQPFKGAEWGPAGCARPGHRFSRAKAPQFPSEAPSRRQNRNYCLLRDMWI